MGKQGNLITLVYEGLCAVKFDLIAILICKFHDDGPPFSGCVRSIKHLKRQNTHK